MPDGFELRASADERKGPDTARSGGYVRVQDGAADLGSDAEIG
jgi:hypothetical protein